MTRLIAIFLAVFFLGLAALMASVTFFVRDPMPVLSNRAPLLIATGDTPDAGLRATLAVDPAFRFEVSGQGARSAAPDLRLRRGEDGNGDIEVETEALGGGSFQGRGQFTAPGRWTLLLDDDGDTTEVPFILQE